MVFEILANTEALNGLTQFGCHTRGFGSLREGVGVSKTKAVGGALVAVCFQCCDASQYMITLNEMNL